MIVNQKVPLSNDAEKTHPLKPVKFLTHISVLHVYRTNIMIHKCAKMSGCYDLKQLPKVEKLMTPKALSGQTARICTHMCLSVYLNKRGSKSLETVF